MHTVVTASVVGMVIDGDVTDWVPLGTARAEHADGLYRETMTWAED